MNVIICTYNNANLLEQTLSTLAAQIVSETRVWSVLVVDNNCNDHTSEVVNQYIYAKTVPGLERIVETQQGLTFARLCGIHHTTDEWIAFVDDDCLLEKDWIEQVMQFANSHPQCGAFGGKVLLRWETPPPPLFVKHAQAFAASDYGEIDQQLSRHRFHIPGAGLVIQREALEKSGWQERQFLGGRQGNVLTSGEDSEIILRILNAGYELWYTPTCILHHFISVRRMTDTYLIKLTYGFGSAAPCIASFRWNHSYLIWLTFSLLRLAKSLLMIFLWKFLTLFQVNRRTEYYLALSWAKGQIDGLIALFTLPRDERNDWLGIFQSRL